MEPKKADSKEHATPNVYSRHSKVQLLVHFVWSTTQRMPWISEDQEPRLHAYIVGICQKLGCSVAAVGGTDDHVHLLIYLNHEITIAELMNRVKGASSHFAKTVLEISDFEWQRGYAVFGVSPHDKAMVINYILQQRARHATNDLWLSAETIDAPNVPKPSESP